MDLGLGLTRQALRLEVPDGWTDVAATLGRLNAGETATRSVPVTPPPSGSAGADTITAIASWTSGAATYTARAGTTGPVPYSSLAEAVNVVAVTADDNPGPGDFGGGGNSYSAQALAEAGATPGATITSRAVDFTWPEATPGTPYAVRTAGQTIELSGQGTHLAFLGAEAGFVAGEFTIRYTDGTEDRQRMQLPNWCCAPQDTGARPLRSGRSTGIPRTARRMPRSRVAGPRSRRPVFELITAKQIS